MPMISAHNDAALDKMYRPGCEHESMLRQKSGDPDLELDLLLASKN